MFEGLRHKHGSLESKTLRDVLEFILLYINAEWGLTEGTASYIEQSWVEWQYCNRISSQLETMSASFMCFFVRLV
jgi:hypothetical protein